MTLTYQEAINQLINNPGDYITVQQLQNLAAQVSVDASGSTTVLYSGGMPDGTNTGDIIAAMLQNGEDIRVIDNTPVASLLTSDEFLAAWGDVYGLDLDEMQDPEFRHAAKDALFDATNSPWADASRRFAEATSGDVRVIAPRANALRVFSQTEIPALLANSSVTSIEGIPIEELRALDSPAEAFQHVKLTSDLNITLGEMNWGFVGDNFVVAKGDYFNTELLNTQQYLIANPDKLQLLSDNIQNLSTEEIADLKNRITGLTSAGEVLANSGINFVNKLGLLGGLVGLALAASQASAAEEAGHHDQAKQIMELWAVDAAGSEVGAVIGTSIGGIALAVVAAAGVTVTAPVAAVVLLGASIAGGFFAADVATDFYSSLSEISEEQKLDIIQRLEKLFFGEDSALTTVVPTDINGNQFGFESIAIGNIQVPRDEIIENAQSSIAWRYALRELNPFVVPDADYTQHNLDGSLDLYNAATGDGFMTDEWIKSRASYLVFDRQYRNSGDTDGSLEISFGLPLPIPGDIQFEDHLNSDSIDLLVDGVDFGLVPTRKIIFGGESGESFVGGAGDDRIFSAGGNDVIDGGEGKDYIESGTGNDTLTGGAGNDDFSGGTGEDTYIFTAGDGFDHILDVLHDDGDVILLDGTDISSYNFVASGGVAGAFGTYQAKSADGLTTYPIMLTYNADGSLTITSGAGGASTGNTIVVDHFSNGDFGLFLEVEDAPNDGVVTVVDFASQGLDPTQYTDTQYILRENSTAQNSINDNRIWLDAETVTWADNTSYQETDNPSLIGAKGIYFEGGDADDVLTGGSRTDEYDGWGGNDFLNMGGDDDLASGGSGSDILLGGEGADVLYGFYNPFWLNEEGERERIIDYDTMETIDNQEGSADSDTLLGQQGTDLLVGGSGNDHLDGGTENDVLYGGAGSDVLLGGDHDDIIFGDSQRQSHYVTGEANQLLIDSADAGSEYNDVIEGGSGNDTLLGEAGRDTIYGGSGQNTIYGDRTNDPTMSLYTALDNADYVALSISAHGNDLLYGGDEVDFIYGNGGDDEIYGGDGNDVIRGDDEFLAVENHGDDIIDGEAGNDTIYGEGGDDFLRGGAGNDTLYGGVGEDTLIGGSGTDTLYGGEGNDTFVHQRGSVDIIDDVDGNNTVITPWANYNGLTLTILGDEVRLGSSSTDQIRFINGSYDNATILINGDELFDPTQLSHDVEILSAAGETVTTTDFNDTVQGGEGGDTIHLGGGNDSTDGFGGNDVIYGEDGNDTLIGGAGNDTIYGGNNADQISGEEGNDTLYGDDGDDTLWGGAGNDVLEGGTGNDFLIAEGAELEDNDSQDTLRGGEGDDTLLGQGGDDFLYGDEGNDQLWAGAGNDELEGGAGEDYLGGEEGDDVIDGGDGADTLVGGAGNDTLLGGSDESADVLIGGEGNDILDGGAGAGDYLEGGNGDDVYLFAAGDGDLYINNLHDIESHQDILRFDSGINPDDVTVERVGDHLIFTLQTTSEFINIQNFFVDSTYELSAVEFADNTTWTIGDLIQKVLVITDSNDFLSGSSGDDMINGQGGRDEIYGYGGDDTLSGGDEGDSLYGGSGNDILNGGEGYDVLRGEDGDDSLIGGDGNDYLYGGAGNDILRSGTKSSSYSTIMQGDSGDDTYLYSLGDGNVTIRNHDEDQDRNDVLRFAAGISPDDIAVTRSPGNWLYLTLVNSGDKITVNNYFINNNYALNEIIFDDGTVWDVSTVEQLALNGSEDSE